MSKEEKAKEAIRNSILIPKEYKVGEYAYNLGYTQAEQDLSSQLTAYKEALSSLWSDIHFTDISKEQIMNRIGSLIQPKP